MNSNLFWETWIEKNSKELKIRKNYLKVIWQDGHSFNRIKQDLLSPKMITILKPICKLVLTGIVGFSQVR
jgi:hypothetical protein